MNRSSIIVICFKTASILLNSPYFQGVAPGHSVVVPPRILAAPAATLEILPSSGKGVFDEHPCVRGITTNHERCVEEARRMIDPILMTDPDRMAEAIARFRGIKEE